MPSGVGTSRTAILLAKSRREICLAKNTRRQTRFQLPKRQVGKCVGIKSVQAGKTLSNVVFHHLETCLSVSISKKNFYLQNIFNFDKIKFTKLPNSRKMKKQIPYGVSNFEKIATENYYFVDKTKHLEEIESVDYPVFLRPRRFGKTLLTEMLRCYYDKKYAHKFQQIFGNYYIGKNPTKKHNTYFFINFNFSGLRAYATKDKDIVEEKFNSNNNSVIYNFLLHYKEELTEVSEFIIN